MRSRTAIDLSVAGAKGASLASVGVTVRVLRGTVANPRGGRRAGRGRSGRTTTVIAGVRLLVPSLRVCVVAATLFVLQTLAVVLPTRMAGMTSVVLLVALVRP